MSKEKLESLYKWLSRVKLPTAADENKASDLGQILLDLINSTDAEELEFLQFFYSNADFGPADDDVRWIIKNDFVKSKGKPLPRGYGDEDE